MGNLATECSPAGSAAPNGLSVLSLLPGPGRALRRLRWSPDGSQLAAASAGPGLSLWQIDDRGTGVPAVQVARQPGPSWDVAWSPDGRTVASGQVLKEALVWRVTDGELLLRLAHSCSVTSVTFAGDGARLATGGHDGAIRLWDAISGQRLSKHRGHAIAINGLAWEPHGSRFASASQDHAVGIWEGASGQPMCRLEGHTRSVLAVAWSPDGSRLASASMDRSVAIWDSRSLGLVARLEGFSGPVTEASFSADGRLIATKSLDDTVRLWDCGSWRCVAALDEPSAARNLLGGTAFRPGQPQLATLGERDTRVRLWGIDVDRLLAGHDAQGEVAEPDAAAHRNQIFISYSHLDRVWLDALKTLLKPLVRGGAISLWDDTAIRGGDRWRQQIAEALAVARVAVLLVSGHFLASDFIAEHELPRLLAAAESEGLVILWIYVSNCLYEVTPIAKYQAAHDLSRSLDQMRKAEQKRVLTDVCRKIKLASCPAEGGRTSSPIRH
jgi:dipeptidyl aminopeptidase/acylaminoacyl peptidase